MGVGIPRVCTDLMRYAIMQSSCVIVQLLECLQKVSIFCSTSRWARRFIMMNQPKRNQARPLLSLYTTLKSLYNYYD